MDLGVYEKCRFLRIPFRVNIMAFSSYFHYKTQKMSIIVARITPNHALQRPVYDLPVLATIIKNNTVFYYRIRQRCVLRSLSGDLGVYEKSSFLRISCSDVFFVFPL